jgi:Bacterial extracellular solute-binding protein/von Willebrand factor type A domain
VKPRERRGRVSRRGRERHVSVPLLVAIAVGISSALMAGLAAQAIVERNSCNDHPLLLNVAVSLDIAPAMQHVGRVFNQQNHQAAGRCVEVQVTQDPNAAVASEVDGQSPSAGLPAIDAWIPDSSLWVDVARAYPLGAQAVQPTGLHVARSPLMIVMPQAAAAQVAAFNSSVGWNFLLPGAIGGPPASLGVRLSLPDPTQSAAGLATLIEISRLLGPGAIARTNFTKFVFTAQPSAQFDDPTSLTAFTTLAEPPLDAHPVTVTSEQAVLTYDAAHPDQPLAARYPSGGSAALGTPELDYPYVLTSTDPAEQAAAKEFQATLEQSDTAPIVRYDNFRSGDGVTGTLPAATGLAQQPLQVATPTVPGETQTDLQAWQRLQVGSRDLVLIDVSSAMGAPSGLPNLTLEQMLTQVANLGLALFPDSTQMGDWEFADNLNGGLPYKVLVPVGPLPASVGLISRRQQLQQINESVRPIPSAPAEIDRAILAGYKEMLASYKPNFTNALIIMTAGVDKARGDIPPAVLISKLRALYSPDRRVELIITKVGTAGNYALLQKIAAAAGGAAYEISDPTQVAKEFFNAVARRICQGTGGCAAP